MTRPRPDGRGRSVCVESYLKQVAAVILSSLAQGNSQIRRRINAGRCYLIKMYSITWKRILKLAICNVDRPVLSNYGNVGLAYAKRRKCCSTSSVPHRNCEDISTPVVFFYHHINRSRGDTERRLDSIANVRRVQYGCEGGYLRIDPRYPLCKSRIVENSILSECGRKLMHEVHDPFRVVDK